MALQQNFSVFTPELWSPRVTEFFKERLVAANVYTDLSADIEEGGDVVHIPNLGDNFSANDVPTTSGNVTGQNIDDTQSQLNIQTWKEATLRLSDYQAKHVANRYNLQSMYMRNIGHTLARTFDSTLLNEWSNFDTTLGDSATDLTSTNIEKALSILESGSVPREDLSLMIHPRQYYGDVFKRSKYYGADTFGRGAPLPSGAIDELYGVPVFRTAQIPASSGSLVAQMVHPETVFYAIGTPGGGQTMNGVRLQEKEPPHLAVKLIGDIIYGAKTVRSGAGVAIKTSNDR